MSYRIVNGRLVNKPNYLDKLAAAPMKLGEVNHAMVAHDDWCALLVTGEACNCNPSVEVISDAEFQRRQKAK